MRSFACSVAGFTAGEFTQKVHPATWAAMTGLALLETPVWHEDKDPSSRDPNVTSEREQSKVKPRSLCAFKHDLKASDSGNKPSKLFLKLPA